jgi:hypothetical protein
MALDGAVEEHGKPGLKLIIPRPKQIIERNLWERGNLEGRISQVLPFPSQGLRRFFEAFQVSTKAFEHPAHIQLMRSLEKMGGLEFLNADEFTAQELRSRIEKIDEHKKLQERMGHRFPLALILAPQGMVLPVHQDFFPQDGEYDVFR